MLKFWYVDSGYCRIMYKYFTDSGHCFYLCIMEENDNDFNVYRCTDDPDYCEPDYIVKPKYKPELSPCDDDLSQRVNKWIEEQKWEEYVKKPSIS